jgi:hypothetical protein
MKGTCVTYDLQVWLWRQIRIAKFHSFGIFNLGSLGYIVSIKLCTRELVIYKREEFVYFKKGRRCRGRFIIGFMTTYIISAYHH